MYQRLVTQFSNTLSQVLLLAPAGEFAQQLQTEFQQRGFSVHFLDLVDFLSNDKLQLELQNQSFYKIITLYGWTEKPLDHQLLTRILKNRHEPTIIISRLDTLPDFSAKEQLRLQQLRQKQLAAIEEFADNLPKKTLLIAQDVVSTDCCHLNFRFICRQQDQSRLTDPEIDFGPLSPAQFIIQNLSVIFSPYDGKRFLFQAEPLKSEKIIFRLSQLSGVTTQIISHPYSVSRSKFSFKPLALFGKTDLSFLTRDFFSHQLQFFDFEKVALPQFKNPSSSKSSLSSTYPFANKNITGALKGTEVNEEFFQKFTQEIASQEEKILRHYHSQAPYQNISLQVPSCNLLRGKLVCSLVEKKDLRIPPIVEISCYHRDDLFFPPAQAPFTTSLQVRQPAKKVIPQKPPVTVKQTLLVKKIEPVKNRQQKPPSSRLRSRKKTLPINPIFIIGAVLFFTAFFIFILPKNYLTTNQKTLQEFFSTCQANSRCFTSKTSSSLSKNFQPNSQTEEINKLVASLEITSRQQQLFNSQVYRLYRTAFQKEPGDVVQEINLVDQAAATLITSLSDVEVDFTSAQKPLQAFIPFNQLNQFKEEITNYKNQLLLWQKYQDIFLVLAQQNQLRIALLLLDNTHLLNQGGQFLALQNLVFSHGEIINTDFISTSELLNNKATKIDNPFIFQESAATAAAGLYNSPYQEKFADFYHILDKIIPNATSEPDLAVSFNLNSYTQLAAAVTGRELEEIFSPIVSQLTTLNLQERENFFINLQQNLGQVITNLSDQEQVVNLLFALLEQFNQQEMLFASRQPALKDLIESTNLNHQLNTRACPSALGGNVCYIDSFVQLRSLLSSSELIPLQINHIVALNPQETVHARTLTYQNLSPFDSMETITFLLPEQTIDLNFSINGKELLSNQDGSYLLTIPAGEKLTAVLTYVIPRSLDQNNFVYSFAEQKQSGAYNQAVTVSFKNNLPYSPKIIAPSATIDGKKITFVSYNRANFLGAVAF